jgi:hypothetical protein
MERFCSFGRRRKGYRSSHLTGLWTLEDVHICNENQLFTKLMFFEYQIEAADNPVRRHLVEAPMLFQSLEKTDLSIISTLQRLCMSHMRLAS